MRVLIISQYFWPESFLINDVAKSLVEKEVDVEVLTGKPNYPTGVFFDGYKFWGHQEEKKLGVLVNRIPLLARGSGAVRLFLNYLSFVFFGILLAPFILRGKKYDVIFVYGVSPILQALPALFLGKLKKAPVIIWVQDLWPESLQATGYINNKIVLQCVEYVVKFIYRHADLLLVQSEAFIQPVKQLAGETPIKYHPNSVDESFALPPKLSVPEIDGLGANFSVLFAGNIGSAQAVEVIVKAADILKESQPDIELVMLGDGSKRAWVLEQVKERGLTNLHLPGRYPIEMMPGFMQQASALLVSLSDQDIFAKTVPNKIQAYMAAGRPIVASMNGEGARLVVEAGIGVSSPSEDGDALSQAILKLYNMPIAERDEMGDKGRAFYKAHYDHEKLIIELIESFQSVMH